MQFINIGYGNLVNSDRILCIVTPDSAPAHRLVTKAKEEGLLIDASQGRKTKGVIVSTDGRIILSALLPDTIAARMHTDSKEEE